jgi:3-Oxoacyl-[acyl-carrier-protein (ACP)] synthase III
VRENPSQRTRCRRGTSASANNFGIHNIPWRDDLPVVQDAPERVPLMNLDLAIIGQGAVTPAGLGIEALLHRKPVPSTISPLSHPEKSCSVLRVDLNDPAFARWQREARLRRASPVTFFLVEAAEQALTGISPVDRAQTGLITTFSAGCLAYSRRFFEGVIAQGMASPALFPETVFNSPASHVAAVLGLNGAAYALVGDETAFIAGLKTAAIWLKQERVKQVLVLGAEEFDSIILDAYGSARWLRNGFLTSEGAAGILVRPAKDGDSSTISTAQDGLIYRTKKEAASAAVQLFDNIDPALPCYPTARHNWLGSLEKRSTEKRTVIPEKYPYLGEAFTASAAWHTIRAAHLLDAQLPHLALPVWGLNHQFGALELEQRK